jgi:hypothetical protein
MTPLRLLSALLVAVALIPPVTAEAASSTYWVDPGGTDGGPGSQAQPWRTLQHAVDRVDPGDTIIVRGGTYAGMRIERPGAPGAWITLSAEPGAIVDRPGPDNRHDSNVELETWDGPGTVSYWVIEGLEVKDAPNWGIDVRGSEDSHSHHITIRSNHVHHNGVASTKTGIFFAFTDDVVVVANDSHHNGEHGIYLSNSGDRFRVNRNHLHDNERCGLHMNGDLSLGGDGTISNGRVVGNLIEGNGAEGCAGINLDGVTKVFIAENVIVENHATGIAVFREDGAVCSRDVTIVNNTIVQAADGRWGLVMGGPGCRDVTLLNNVILTRHAWRGAIEMPTDGMPGLVSDHNIFTGRFTTDGGSSVKDLGAWRSATGQDAASSTASIAATFLPGSYRHRADGPAQDAGTPTTSTRDHERVTRPMNGAWDVGAFETPTCRGRLATIIGTNGNDVIEGTAGADVVASLRGNDAVDLGNGDDVACGGRGRDQLFGGGGDDRLYGQQGRDLIDGGIGHDVADGGRGDDTCVATEVAKLCEL